MHMPRAESSEAYARSSEKPFQDCAKSPNHTPPLLSCIAPQSDHVSRLSIQSDQPQDISYRASEGTGDTDMQSITPHPFPPWPDLRPLKYLHETNLLLFVTKNGPSVPYSACLSGNMLKGGHY